MSPVGRSSTSYSADAIIPLTSLGEKQTKEEVQFLRSQNYCVCFIQMVKVNDSYNIRKYYTVFIKPMSTMARNFGAKIVKNITDSFIIRSIIKDESKSYSSTRRFRIALRSCSCILTKSTSP
ncbi:MAG: hypothetical protein WAM14_14845 [Candidatus Nitrosopolaris sp.]